MGTGGLIIIFFLRELICTSLLVGHEGSAVSTSCAIWRMECLQRVRTRDPIFSYADPEDDSMEQGDIPGIVCPQWIGQPDREERVLVFACE